MRPRTLVAALVLALAALVGAAVWLARPPARADTRLSLAEAMRSDTTGYARATAVRPFVFPADHGPHPDFRTEWWYLTGNLDVATNGGDPSSGGPSERLGVDLTIFRIALTPGAPAAPSDSARTDTSGWQTRQMFMAHAGVTDAARQRFVADERFSRGAAGLAGAQAPRDGQPFRVWLEDWEIAEGPGGVSGPLPTFRVRASAGRGDSLTRFDLVLRTEKPAVLQGDRGLSQKGPEPGNASYYYTLPRLAATGTVTRGGRTEAATGTVWMDREWSTSALGPDEVGWDWFALHLTDGRDLMLYRLRRRDGTAAPLSKGSVSPAAGPARRLALADYTLRPTRTWTSPHSGARYPVEWEVAVPSENLRLRVRAVMPDQELNVSVRYWEGAVDVTNAATGAALGRGYLEMTGYGDEGRAARGTRASG